MNINEINRLKKLINTTNTSQHNLLQLINNNKLYNTHKGSIVLNILHNTSNKITDTKEILKETLSHNDFEYFNNELIIAIMTLDNITKFINPQPISNNTIISVDTLQANNTTT